MSDTDSFIDEVTEEVRRDRLFAMIRKYGWIAGLAVALIVGGAAWTEYNKAQTRAMAERLGDSVLGAMGGASVETRLAGLEEIVADGEGAQAVVSLLTAAEAQLAGDTARAVELLDEVAVNGEVPEIYRQIAAFKSLALQAETMDPAARRHQLEALAQPGSDFSLLAQEQLALQDIAEGQSQAAIERFQAILRDANVGPDLQRRALQMIVALGGTPDIGDLPEVAN